MFIMISKGNNLERESLNLWIPVKSVDYYEEFLVMYESQ